MSATGSIGKMTIEQTIETIERRSRDVWDFGSKLMYHAYKENPFNLDKWHEEYAKEPSCKELLKTGGYDQAMREKYKRVFERVVRCN